MDAGRVVGMDLDEMVGRDDAPAGTPPWCAHMRTRLQELLDRAKIDHECLEMCLESFERHEGWRLVKDAKGLPFESYTAFCLHRRPHGLGRRREEIDQLIKEGKDAKRLAADPAVTPLAEHGGDRRSEEANQDANGMLKIGSNQASYLVRRLKRDHPEIAEALARGEYPSARAAALAAGIVRVPTPLDVLKRAWHKAAPSERAAFLDWTETLEAGA